MRSRRRLLSVAVALVCAVDVSAPPEIFLPE